MCIARYTLAVDRRGRVSEGQPSADFISCVAFGKGGEFAEKYLKQGTKIAVTGKLQTGSYTDKDGKKVYTTDVNVEDQEFCEKKNSNDQPPTAPEPSAEQFMDVSGMTDSLPFKK